MSAAFVKAITTEFDFLRYNQQPVYTKQQHKECAREIVRCRTKTRELPAVLQTKIYAAGNISTWFSTAGIFDPRPRDLEVENAVESSAVEKLRELGIIRNPVMTAKEQLVQHIFEFTYVHAPLEKKQEIVNLMSPDFIMIKTAGSRIRSNVSKAAVVVRRVLMNPFVQIMTNLANIYIAYKVYVFSRAFVPTIVAQLSRTIIPRIVNWIVNYSPRIVIKGIDKILMVVQWLFKHQFKVWIYSTLANFMFDRNTQLGRKVRLIGAICSLPTTIPEAIGELPFTLAMKVWRFDPVPLADSLAAAPLHDALYLAGKMEEAEALWMQTMRKALSNVTGRRLFVPPPLFSAADFAVLT